VRHFLTPSLSMTIQRGEMCKLFLLFPELYIVCCRKAIQGFSKNALPSAGHLNYVVLFWWVARSLDLSLRLTSWDVDFGDWGNSEWMLQWNRKLGYIIL